MSKEEKMKRITSRSLVKLINEMLVQLEIKAECIKVVKTRFRGQDYEGGARIFYAIVKTTDGECQIDGYNQYYEIQNAINEGKKLILKTDGRCICSLSQYYITYN